MKHVVVVGAGQAGFSFVSKLRNLGSEDTITLIGSESAPPYQRPPLSKKYLLGEMDIERLYLRPLSFYKDQNINLRLNIEVTSVNSAEKTISVGDEIINYDELVFTTGSIPNYLPAKLGGNLNGVYVVRNLSDVDSIVSEFIEKRHVLIIGGGYIGLEAAAVASKLGLQVTLVEMGERILQRVACSETSDYFRDLHKDHGVNILENVGVKQLIGNDRVEGVELTDGSNIDVDFVIVGIGITPSTKLAEIAGCEIDNGIKTDSKGSTSVKSIWAAGDCASFPYKDTRIRLESVPNAIEQAELVAENIMHINNEYVAKPWFWSDQFDVKLQIAGLNSGFNDVVTRKSPTSVSFWYYKDHQLLAVDAMNDPRAYMIGKRLIEAGRSPSKDLIEDIAVDLKSLL